MVTPYNPNDPYYAMRLNPARNTMEVPNRLIPSHQQFMGQPHYQPKPPVAPLSDISATGTAGVAAQDTLGETAKGPELQPGNRRSIKEYLAQIRELRNVLSQRGVPEDQLPVPTFTNIQGGQADIAQGEMPMPGGQVGPGQEVRSYVYPEWQQTDQGMVMGEAHPIRQAQERISQSKAITDIKNVTNPIDKRYPMTHAFTLIDDAMAQFYNENGRYPTEQETDQIFNNLLRQGFENQREIISKLKKDFKDADTQALFNAYETGDWSYAADAKQNFLSQQRIGKVADDAQKMWDELEKQNAKPMMGDTGEYFNSSSEYMQYKVQEYIENINNLLDSLAQMKKSEESGPQNKKQPTSGPQYNPPASTGNQNVVRQGTDKKTGRRVFQLADGRTVYEDGTPYAK